MRFASNALGLVAIAAVCSATPIQAHDYDAPESEQSCSTRVAALDKDFVTGAFASCETSGKKRFRITIAPEDDGDINCSPWYAFRLTSERKARVRVQIDYTKCGHRYWPKTSTDGETWTYLPESAVEIDGEGDDRSALITLKLGKEPVFVAAQEILPPSTYDAWLDGLETSPFAKRELLGKSAEDRDIEVLTIADLAASQRETVVLVGRQHPPEVTGALAMLPFVETLMGDSDLAKAYRARFETVVVPLLNPDGVVRGHWRHNTGGVDLNRDWGPFTQPETRLMDGVLKEIAADPERRLRTLIDFHSTRRDIFYTIPDELPTDPPLFTRKWLELYQERMPGYEVTRDARHTVGRPISKGYSFDTYGVPGITFEIGDETDRELIKRIGRESAIALMVTLLETPSN
ncbi:M14-type cytosolic carboxypeptidase [uncultured Erythrobacter sp.]|uniref:M14 family metallopeptidase n=1 Tax=uncultured Erythrobacter sp. TaxID=263913 RepID=UPI00262C2E68|nr:M14-type cytosolic carboxypeptidase [uncultured Erythrobacter sp.]